ncbi:RecX family transcriptional regulator [Tigheibacillus jepli]|uniref:RecX family transcriptional regulator n=1 Tax=Tigheibacillus jepli TaxID=3035914 RepID=UPI00387E06AA
MQKISRITIQKKNTRRFNIFLNEKYAFSVDEDILVKYNLRKGLELSDEAIAELQKQDNIQKAYSMAVNFLSYRMRTKKEIQNYLREKEVEPQQIDAVIDRLQNEKLIDDREFANAFVHDRMEFSTKGPLIIRQELQKKVLLLKRH